ADVGPHLDQAAACLARKVREKAPPGGLAPPRSWDRSEWTHTGRYLRRARSAARKCCCAQWRAAGPRFGAPRVFGQSVVRCDIVRTDGGPPAAILLRVENKTRTL